MNDGIVHEVHWRRPAGATGAGVPCAPHRVVERDKVAVRWTHVRNRSDQNRAYSRRVALRIAAAVMLNTSVNGSETSCIAIPLRLFSAEKQCSKQAQSDRNRCWVKGLFSDDLDAFTYQLCFVCICFLQDFGRGSVE